MHIPSTIRHLVAVVAMGFASLVTVSCAPAEAPAERPLYTEAAAQPNDETISASRRNAITKAVEKCSPAVVGINVTEVRTQVYRDPWSGFFDDDPIFRRFFGDRGRTYQRQYEVRGLGSGFLISNDGYIITNDHVAGNASKVVVTMTNGEKYDAAVVGSDPVSDVALLKIEGKNFPYLRLSNSDNVIVGEWSIAFGNPFGLFDINAKPTVTVGVISNTGVDFTQPDMNGLERVYRGMLQTDAAISSGNSGGPLVNADGDVVGVNTVIYSTAQSQRGAGSIGIGFAIPINRVKRIVDRLQKDGKIDRDFWTGMEVQEVDEQMARQYGLNVKEGVMISQIVRDSPAESAGLEPGDVIMSIEGRKVLRAEDVKVSILDAETSGQLKLVIRRGTEEKTVIMKLSPRPRRGGVRQ
ncbi:MAG TPA: 2-alkenal reductase [Bacteroidetes bacterium]|nr:2-alkenal reductase [Bacteroidota bacterium]HRK06015.1 trypsin-like peptidase domain-containing protein [Chlorobiota bacterium]